jgi:hypothetical protein
VTTILTHGDYDFRANPGLAENIAELWGKVSGGPKQHNGQLDVVIALWRGNDIVFA